MKPILPSALALASALVPVSKREVKEIHDQKKTHRDCRLFDRHHRHLHDGGLRIRTLRCRVGRVSDGGPSREALDRALGAWKDGKSAESLKSDNPAIVVSDHLWNKGAPLIKYEIEKGDHRNGANQRFKVVLWFKDEKGKEKKEKTEYDVGTDPVITVVRPF